MYQSFNSFPSNNQSMFSPGFAGTNPQQVRQDIARESQGYASQPQFSQVSQFGGAQSMFQPGFAGTNPQQVRQDIARESQFGFSPYQGQQQLQQFSPLQSQQQQQFQPQFSQVSQFGSAQSMFQPGFAGTNPQQVRQDIARESQGFGSQSFGSQGFNSQGLQQAQQFGGGHSMLQPGFAGTNPQQVRQDIRQEVYPQQSFNQQSLNQQSFNQQQFSPYQF